MIHVVISFVGFDFVVINVNILLLPFQRGSALPPSVISQSWLRRIEMNTAAIIADTIAHFAAQFTYPGKRNLFRHRKAPRIQFQTAFCRPCLVRNCAREQGPIRCGVAFLARWLTPSAATNAGGYGSPLSAGTTRGGARSLAMNF